MYDDHAIHRFRNQFRALQQRLRQESLPLTGASRTAFQVMGAIDRLHEPTPRDIAVELYMTSSNVAAALRELDAIDYVRRTPDQDDRRRTRLSLTESGQGAVREFRAKRDAWLGASMAAALSPQEVELLLAAGGLMQRLAEYRGDGTESASAGEAE